MRSPGRAPCRCSATPSTSTGPTRSAASCGWRRSTGRSSRSSPGWHGLLRRRGRSWSTRSATTRGSTSGSAAAWPTCARARPDSGLFTADDRRPAVARAHNILMAPFSLQAMRDYMPKMLDIADQLMDKWARLNPGEEVDVTADMTRLTLDTIALCGFGYRFNSFYRDTPHPFVDAMVRDARRVADPDAPAAGPDPAAGPRATAAGGGPGVHERPGRRDHRRAPGAGRRRGQHRPARPDAHRRRQADRARGCRTRTSGRSASPSSSPGTRRPRACCRSRSTSCSTTRTSWPGPAPRSTRCSAAPPRPPSSRCTG